MQLPPISPRTPLGDAQTPLSGRFPAASGKIAAALCGLAAPGTALAADPSALAGLAQTANLPYAVTGAYATALLLNNVFKTDPEAQGFFAKLRSLKLSDQSVGGVLGGAVAQIGLYAVPLFVLNAGLGAFLPEAVYAQNVWVQSAALLVASHGIFRWIRRQEKIVEATYDERDNPFDVIFNELIDELEPGAAQEGEKKRRAHAQPKKEDAPKKLIQEYTVDEVLAAVKDATAGEDDRNWLLVNYALKRDDLSAADYQRLEDAATSRRFKTRIRRHADNIAEKRRAELEKQLAKIDTDDVYSLSVDGKPDDVKRDLFRGVVRKIWTIEGSDARRQKLMVLADDQLAKIQTYAYREGVLREIVQALADPRKEIRDDAVWALNRILATGGLVPGRDEIAALALCVDALLKEQQNPDVQIEGRPFLAELVRLATAGASEKAASAGLPREVLMRAAAAAKTGTVSS